MSAQGSLDAALAGLTLIAEQYEGVEVVSALLNEEYDGSDTPVEVVDVSFTINGRPGIFAVHPPFNPEWDTNSLLLIYQKRFQVEAIYKGYANQEAAALDPTGLSPGTTGAGPVT